MTTNDPSGLLSDGDLTLDRDPSRPPAGTAHEGLPREIGGFRILGKLGEGGMGIVYEAEQQSPHRRVALKVVRGGQFVDDVYLRMFRRETETLARLAHPNIAAIYEAGRTEDGQHFFTMELVTGQNLRAHVRDKLGGERPTLEQLRSRLELFNTICARRELRAPARRHPPRPEALQPRRHGIGRGEDPRLRARAHHGRRRRGRDRDERDGS